MQFQFSVCMYGTCGRIDNKADFDFDLLIVYCLKQWFSKCGMRTTSGTWASSRGTQRNLWIKYKLGHVHQSGVFFFEASEFFQLF